MIKIVLCDDWPVLRNGLQEIIRAYGAQRGVQFEYFLFESGEKLLEEFEKNKELADVYFLDYFMLEINGLQAAQHIRKYDKDCDIVFVTSAVYDVDLHEFMEVSPLEVLSKPAKKEEVFSVLDRVLIRKNQRGDSEDVFNVLNEILIEKNQRGGSEADCDSRELRAILRYGRKDAFFFQADTA